jgi:putative serine protease PepD
MTDHLWSTPEKQAVDELTGWRPERPEPARSRPVPPPPSSGSPARELPRREAPRETPSDEAVDVAAAAARVRGATDPEPAPTEGKRRRGSAAPAAAAVVAKTKASAPVAPPALPQDPSQAATRVHQRDEQSVGVAEAARRVRERQQTVQSAPSNGSGSPYAARRRPAPDLPAEGRRRTWVAPFLSALVGALVVVIVFLLFFRTGDGNGGSSSSAQAPLPATSGAGGSNANARTIYARAAGSVVSIQSKMASGTATGTGFVISDKSTIVTNSHVVGTAKSVEVQFGQNTTPISATVLGRDVSTDLAVIRINPSAHGAAPLPLADSADVKVGDGVVAIGNPFGLDRTATAGIVSALGRHISAPNGFDIDDVIQTDAPINPGNSGGPLIDARGRVIGINSQIATASGGGGNVGIGFAVPANTIRKIVPQLESGHKVSHAFLGVSTSTGSAGAKVAQVTPSGPADTAGIRTGDEIVSVGGHKVTRSDELGAAVSKAKPGDDVQVEIIRGGVHQTIDVRLGNRPGGG